MPGDAVVPSGISPLWHSTHRLLPFWLSVRSAAASNSSFQTPSAVPFSCGVWQPTQVMPYLASAPVRLAGCPAR